MIQSWLGYIEAAASEKNVDLQDGTLCTPGLLGLPSLQAKARQEICGAGTPWPFPRGSQSANLHENVVSQCGGFRKSGYPKCFF